MSGHSPPRSKDNPPKWDIEVMDIAAFLESACKFPHFFSKFFAYGLLTAVRVLGHHKSYLARLCR